MRRLVDAHGREWHVFERSSGDVFPGPGRSSLIFDTEGLVRRLWHYPASWATLSDPDLLGLMDTTRLGAPMT
jgi:hypothetical protein